MRQSNPCHRCATAPALLHDLQLQLVAVLAAQRSLRHGVHDLHRAHYLYEQASVQDGLAGRLRFIDDGELPADNNWVENQIRPIALGRINWLFAGSLRAGKRAAAVMSLVHSARLNGHDPHAYLRDVLDRLPTHPVSRIEELLPHHWQAPTT